MTTENLDNLRSKQTLEKANPAIILEYAVWQMTSGSEARR